jgi:hypothetical protein
MIEHQMCDGQMMEYGIKFRPSKPASLHLNGKVERSHKTEFDNLKWPHLII